MVIPVRLWLRRCTLAGLLAVTTASSACVGNHALVRRNAPHADDLSWFGPVSESDQRRLDHWASGVGPPYRRALQTAPPASDRLLVVNWNTSVGSADVVELVRGLRVASGDDVPLVLLLQEAYRRGEGVPALVPPGTAYPHHLGNDEPSRSEQDISTIAERTQLGAYYVPSMRNGGDRSNEDRGNAILSNLPLTDVTAIELPFEGQRRVAVAATVTGSAADGRAWHIRVVSAHLDNVVGPRRLWFALSEHARARQARALVSYLADAEAVVLAGDFNTWFGFGDLAYVETARAFPGWPERDRRATFGRLLRLDHAFFRLPAGWRADVRRGDERLGSDHYPLISSITLSAGSYNFQIPR